MTEKMKVRSMKKYIYQANTKENEAMLQYKINLKEKSNIRYKDDHRSRMKGKNSLEKYCT